MKTIQDTNNRINILIIQERIRASILGLGVNIKDNGGPKEQLKNLKTGNNVERSIFFRFLEADLAFAKRTNIPLDKSLNEAATELLRHKNERR